MDTQENDKQEEQKTKQERHAIAAFVLGLFSVITPLQLFGGGFLIGLILSIVGLHQVSLAGGIKENGFARTGKILSIIGLVLSVLLLIATGLLLARFSRYMGPLIRNSPFRLRPMMRHRFIF